MAKKADRRIKAEEFPVIEERRGDRDERERILDEKRDIPSFFDDEQDDCFEENANFSNNPCCL